MSPEFYTEASLVEGPALELLAELGWTVVNAYSETFGPSGTLGRDSMHEVVLTHRLRKALAALNPEVPDAAREEALTVLTKNRSVMDPVRANQEVRTLIRDGYRAEWQDPYGDRQFATVRYLDFTDPTSNHLMAASQVWIAGDLHRRRADTVLFVNGIPLVLAEFKEINRPVKAAYDENLTDYRDTIPQLFTYNGLVILSNGSQAKVGATFASWSYFNDWKRVDSEGHRGVVALETAIRGTCTPERLLDVVDNFTAFIERPGGLIKTVELPATTNTWASTTPSKTCCASGPRATSDWAFSGTPRARARACPWSGSPKKYSGVSPAAGPLSWSPTALSWTSSSTASSPMPGLSHGRHGCTPRTPTTCESCSPPTIAMSSRSSTSSGCKATKPPCRYSPTATT